MPDFTVRQYGTDSSGRPVLMTAYMHDWWESVVEALGFRPTIIQGAFMARLGGGASASSGFHDEAGCLDVRTRDLTVAQIDRLIRATRQRAGASWRRDQTAAHGGMDPHCHITLGSDRPLSPGAEVSWTSYLFDGDGLAGPGSDYEWRPDPLVTTPPEEDEVTPEDLTKIVAAVKGLVPTTDEIVQALLAAEVRKETKTQNAVTARRAWRETFEAVESP